MARSLPLALLVAAASIRLVTAPPPPAVLRTKETIIDHFRYTNNHTFTQQWLLHDAYWSAGRPLFVFVGGEGAVQDFYENSGGVFELAEQAGALVAMLEHRYYGYSLPFGPGASYEPHGLHFLSVEQALADLSVFIEHLKIERACARGASPVVLFGGSYGGMLAAWHRRAYPHLTVGALASSAPVDFYPGEGKQKQFWDATLATFAEFGGRAGCDVDVQTALDAVARLGQDVPGRAGLSDAFATCSPLETPLHVKQLLFYIRGAVATMAMADYPEPTSFVTPMPAFPVAFACGRWDAAAASPQANLNALINVFLNFTGVLPCHDTRAELLGESAPCGFGSWSPLLRSPRAAAALSLRLGGDALSPSGGLGDISIPWQYQACTQLILEPLTSDGFGFYPEDDSDVPSVEAACSARFGVVSRPGWLPLSTGRGDVSSLSNVIFSDGEKDPWKVGSPPFFAAEAEQLSPTATAAAVSPPSSVLQLLIPGAAHHEDLRASSGGDSPALCAARALECRTIVGGWLGQGGAGARCDARYACQTRVA